MTGPTAMEGERAFVSLVRCWVTACDTSVGVTVCDTSVGVTAVGVSMVYGMIACDCVGDCTGDIVRVVVRVTVRVFAQAPGAVRY